MNKSGRPFRVGLLGYGFAGKTFHAPLIAACESLSLHAVASRDAAKVHADFPDATVYRAPEDLIADDMIDLVVIATPNDTHAPLARAALEAGRDVVVDKPFALNLEEARGLIALAKARGRQLQVFHNRRWDSDFLTIRRAIESGLLRRVTHFESRIDRFRPQVRDRWREHAVPGAGIWFDLGPHMVDQALALFGLPDSVTASIATQRDGAQIDDWAHAVLNYGERRVIIHAGMLVAGGSARFTVHGTGGSAVKAKADGQEAQLLSGIRPGAPGWGEDADDLIFFSGSGEPRTIAATAGDQRGFYTAVASALAGEGPLPVRPIEALAVMAVLEAGAASARDGCTMQLPLTPDERALW
ncbi:oxidoreductase [Novosphingobium guangzhouense]|uniref:Oxidoreductase n=1 Tax=Novosphingobium guangzhouense TaxID=1850347 RepID=A0A2K2G6T8_9SPHN|nr:oxidoreductase [Novosphingobium guangzhouense]PNU06755.1 oxidoreductase [Novosphingobium guangzhouense]